jgi:hypothetical protein
VFAHRQNREIGTAWQEAMRNRFEPSQVVQAGFGLGRIAVTQRVNGCYCVPERPDGSGGTPQGARPMKDTERCDKRSVRTGKDVSPGKARPPFQSASDPTNGTDGL